ncbi:hypothetical protein QQ045_018869 [Rhodiola kirilowii]
MDNHSINDDWEHIQIRSQSSSSSDDHLSIFPPSLHQDLSIINPLPLPTSPSSSSSISSQRSDPDPEPKDWILRLICRQVWLRLLAMKSKVANLAAKFYSFYRSWKGGILSVMFVTLVWINKRRWRRRRVAEEDVSRLRKLVKEKDRVIDKLLLEIAQMSDELSGRRAVPVYRVR